MKFKQIAILVCVLLVDYVGLADSSGSGLWVSTSIGETANDLPARSTVARWRWLKDTYWYVLTSNLLAYVFVAQTQELQAVSDQTVFHITDYRDGYFWGKTVVKLGTLPAMCLSLVGSVTPEGRVLLTFTPIDTTASAAVTQGVGQMRFKFGNWTMENQMSSGPTQLQVTHWAYMIQSQPDQPSWQSLPGVGISIDQFLAQCPEGPHLRTD